MRCICRLVDVLFCFFVIEAQDSVASEYVFVFVQPDNIEINFIFAEYAISSYRMSSDCFFSALAFSLGAKVCPLPGVSVWTNARRERLQVRAASRSPAARNAELLIQSTNNLRCMRKTAYYGSPRENV